MNRFRCVARAFAILTLTLSSATAQGRRRAPVILTLPAGPRSLALGNTGIGSHDDEAIFFNPAQVAIDTGFSASAERLSATASTAAISAVTRFNRTGGIGISMRMATFDETAQGFPANRLTLLAPGAGAATSLEAGIAGAQVVKSVRIGALVKYVEEVGNGNRLARGLLDVGVSRDVLRSTFGLAVQNIGHDMTDAAGPIQLPIRTTLGAARSGSVGPYDLRATAAVSLIRTDFVQPSGGIEANYSWLSGYDVALRAGLRRATVGEEPFTAGAGFTMDRLSIDYALETLPNQRLGHRIGLHVR